jgi:hypothetical protein
MKKRRMQNIIFLDEKSSYQVRFQVLTAMKMTRLFFWGCRVYSSADTNILEKHTVSSLNLKMETVCSSEMLVFVDEYTQHHNPGESLPHISIMYDKRIYFLEM